MAYTTIAKVQALFRNLQVDVDTAVTTDEVTEMISEVDAEIDAKLSDHYEVPITGTEALKIVGKIARLKVAHLIKTVLESTNELSDREQDVQTNLEKKADKMLKDIIPTWDSSARVWVEPTMQLTDATRKQKSPRTGNLFGSSSSSTSATIKKGGDNW